MDKKWREISIFAGFSLIAILIIGLVVFNYNTPATAGEAVYKGDAQNVTQIEELHFEKIPITYSFAEPNTRDNNIKCPDYQIERIKQAFSIIEDETGGIVSFQEVENNGDITVFCNGAKADTLSLMRTGDSSYNSYGNVITSGELNFYTHYNCGTYPDTEIHEILHALGFNHEENNKDSIMYPIASKCDLGKIDEDIITKLKEIYSNPSLSKI